MGVETVLIGAAIGAGIGAIGGAVSGGGDRIWQGALTGAVGGAITGGVGSWASGASGLGLGNVAGYALGGALGGMGAGALGTALGGGNSSDYLRNIATGGVLGGATGALGGYLAPGAAAGGGEAALGATGAEGAAGSGLAQGGTGLETGGVQGMTGGTGATGVEATITGPTTTAPQMTTPALADTVGGLSQGGAGLETGGAMGGGSTVAPSLSTTTPTNTQSLNNLYNVDTATGSYGPKGELLGTWDTNTNAYVDASKAGLDTANASYGPKGEVRGIWDAEQGMYSNQPGFKAGEGGVGWGLPKGSKMTDLSLEDYLKMQGKAQLLGGGIKALGAIATAPETQQNRNQLMDLYNQQNAANQFYQNQLQQTYTNPMGYLGSGEAAATRSAALRQALAQNAAAGRRTQGGALANQLMQTQLQNLQNYRRGIPQPQYGTAAQTLNFAQQYSPTADIFGGVASMATPLSLYSLFG